MVARAFTRSRQERAEAKRFVQIKTVVMMSDAWRACNHSARCAFLELSARLQWSTGDSEPINNGHLWLSRDEWIRAGFAPATVTRAVKQLIKVGLLYRTRAGGIGRGCSEYALTCFAPVKDTSGLFLQGFRKNAWDKYATEPKKTRESKMNRDRFKNDELPHQNGDKPIKSEQAPEIKSVHQESESTIYGLRNSLAALVVDEIKQRAPSHTTPYLIRRQTTADRDQLRVIH